MKNQTLTHWIDRVRQFSWALLLLTLPVTSFPFFPGGVGGETLIRPLAIYPLILLVVLVTIPRLFTRPLPRTLLPLLGFVVLATLSSILALTTGTSSLRGIPMSDRIFRNLITLAIGCAFFLTVVLYPKSLQDLTRSLRWLYIGFGIALLWGSLQAIYVIHFDPGYFDWMNQLQSLISTRKLFETRISGMTFEPKWFAEQLSFLLLPWLVGSVISRQSVFKWRFRWITIELLLLIWAVGVLLFTFSRTGFVLLILTTFLGILLSRIMMRGEPRTGKRSILNRRVILPAVIATLAMTAVILVVGTQNRYFSRIWRYWTSDSPRRLSFLEYIVVEQRLVYWETAYRMYEDSPFLGVGLGNYAFYFDEFLPNDPANRQTEILRQLTPVEGRVRLITAKNLYARLLAETGLVGTITFTTFVIAVFGCVLYLLFSRGTKQKFWGISGFISMAIFAVLILSFDSFAIPNMWIVFGLITAATHLPSSSSSAEANKLTGNPLQPEVSPETQQTTP